MSPTVTEASGTCGFSPGFALGWHPAIDTSNIAANHSLIGTSLAALKPSLCTIAHMEGLTDTIAAPITPPGSGAVAIVRLSGPRALPIALAVTGRQTLRPRHAHHVTYSTGDDGLAVYFPEGASYTGENSVELSLHGSPASVELLLQTLGTHGCRPAKPGEFTLRAFMNGRLDLAEAEGVRATIEATTAKQLRLANELRSGATVSLVGKVHDAAATVLAMVEAATDFSEETGELDTALALARIADAQSFTLSLLATQNATRVLRQGLQIAILGRPNAGKSSLFNRLLAYDRSIVTPVPGTTRDTVTGQIVVAGVPVTLTDTAGIRESNDHIEQEGVARSLAAASSADLVLWVFDSQLGWTPEEDKIVADITAPVIVIGNKADVAQPPAPALAVSAKTGEGADIVLREIGAQIAVLGEPTFLLDRHYDLLIEVGNSLEEARFAIADPAMPDDVATVPLRAVIRLSGQILGREVPADVIDAVFANFCIGK